MFFIFNRVLNETTQSLECNNIMLKGWGAVGILVYTKSLNPVMNELFNFVILSAFSIFTLYFSKQ